MTKDDFLIICSTVGVAAIQPIGNEFDDGFKVVLKDGSLMYVIHRFEHGDAWIEYETGAKFDERWRNTKILTPEEAHEFNRRTIESIQRKYSSPHFEMFCEHLNIGKKITN